MKAEQINNMIYFLINMVIMLLIVMFIDLVLIGIWLLVVQKMEKLNGYQMNISPGERKAAEHDINKMQHIKAKLNGNEIEVEVSKKLIKWGFKNRFNYWLMCKYLMYLALEAQERGKHEQS